jgi:hypothetical protein
METSMSAAAQKDLNYYLTHADEMPTDPKEIERLANAHMDAAMEAGTEQMDVNKIVGKADETPGAAAAETVEVKTDEPVKAKAETPAAAGTPAAEEAKPDGILAKDGKNVIPYSQLESARARAAAAEALARDQAAELATLRAAKTAPEQVEDADMLTDEELTVLEADSPTLAKTLRAQQAAIRQLRETVDSVTQRQASDAAAQAAEVKSEVQTAIDSNPTLAAWQTSEDQTMWDRASGFDKLLRAMPEYANVSFADRFAKVVEMTQSALGIEPEPEPSPQKQEEQLTPAQIKAAATARLAQAGKGKKPLSLSDVPGGAPPAVDERQKVEEMSTVGLGQMFLGMTQEQRDAYLASL